jgi:PAS domain S-box-containing protein
MKKHSKADSGIEGKARASYKSQATLHQAEQELQFRLEFGKLISSVSAKLAGFKPQQFKEVTDLVLKKIGEFAGVDRCYIVLFSDGRASPRDIHVWRASGMAKIHIDDRGFSFDSFPWVMGKLKKLEHIRILNIRDLPSSAKAEREVFERFDIDSLLVIPVACESRLIGCLGFTSSNDKRMWNDDIIALLRMLGESFANAYERKKIEEDLRESEEKFRRIVERNFDMIFTADLEGRLTYASPSVKRVLGYHADEMIGKLTTDFASEIETARVVQSFEDIAEGKDVEGQQLSLVKKDGTVAYIELNSSPIYRDGKIVGATAIARDITERKSAEEAMRESEEKYRLLIENAGEAIFSVDYDGTFLVMNKTAAQYLGGEPEEFVGKTMWDIFPKEISDRQINSIRQTIRYGRSQVKEEMTSVGEKERWFRTSIHPIHDSDGQITSAQLIAHNITEERQLDIRNAGRMRLLDNLRNAKDIDQCLQFGCEALHDARLFKRAVLTLNNEDRQITHLGQIGFEENVVMAAKDSHPLGKEIVKKIVQEKYKISHSFFIPVEDGLNLDSSGRYIRQKKKRGIAKETHWQAGDELFVPVLGEDGKFEGWLSVDTPFDSGRPSYHTVRFLEEVVDIVTQQVQEIRSRGKLDLERRALQEKNIAIKEVLAHIEEEKMGIKRLMTESIDNTLLPILNKLADENKTVNSTYFDLLKSGLIDLASQSGGSQHVYAKLSPREKEICILIRGQASNKEIAEALKITLGTVRKHREAIRRKLGLTNRKVNLSAYLNNA